MDGQVVVRGEAERRTLPDWALVRVTIRGEGASRDDAYRIAAADAAAVDAALDERDPAPRSIGHGTLVVQPRKRWKKGEPVRTGWLATRTSTVEVVDFGGLGELLAELAGAGADIAGPDWQVDPSNTAYQDARRDAAIDARQRAEAYVQALGLSIGGVRWMAEPGLGRDNSESVHFATMAAAGGRYRGGEEEGEIIDVTPRETTVRAQVEIGFELNNPT
jgi:uncharacterized protein YggE